MNLQTDALVKNKNRALNIFPGATDERLALLLALPKDFVTINLVTYLKHLSLLHYIQKYVVNDMETEIHRQISKLIKKLKMNDGKRASDYEEEPKEPKGVMDALVKIGEPAVEPLLELLKDTSRYSCLYAIKVLGEVQDPRAVQPIIEAFSSEGFAEEFWRGEDYEEPRLALQKIGLPALEPTLNYLKEKREKDNEIGMCNALEILAGIKDEKSFMALVNMLSHPNSEVQDTAIMLLGDYGDKRAVEYLKKLLENVDARNTVADAIRKLVSAREYREIIAPYPFADLDSYRREIDMYLRDIEYAHKHPSRFEGDNAEELSAIAQEYKIRESIENLLRKAAELAVYEAVISDDMYKQLDTAFWKLWEKRQKLKREHEEEIDIIEGYIPGTVLKEEKDRIRVSHLSPRSLSIQSWIHSEQEFGGG